MNTDRVAALTDNTTNRVVDCARRAPVPHWVPHRWFAVVMGAPAVSVIAVNVTVLVAI
jgi:hypothetical protein